MAYPEFDSKIIMLDEVLGRISGLYGLMMIIGLSLFSK